MPRTLWQKFHVDPEATPKFYRPRSVPYAIKGKIEQELQRLEHEGVVSKVVESEWAAPIVPVMKSDGSVRLCGDYKVTVNQAIKSDSYPLPRTEDILASLAGGKAFTKLDLAHAYQQLPLDEDLRKSSLSIPTKGYINSTAYHSESHLHHQFFSEPLRAFCRDWTMSLCTWMTYFDRND